MRHRNIGHGSHACPARPALNARLARNHRNDRGSASHRHLGSLADQLALWPAGRVSAQPVSAGESGGVNGGDGSLFVNWVTQCYQRAAFLRLIWRSSNVLAAELSLSSHARSCKSALAIDLVCRYSLAHGLLVSETLHLVPDALAQARQAVDTLLRSEAVMYPGRGGQGTVAARYNPIA